MFQYLTKGIVIVGTSLIEYSITLFSGQDKLLGYLKLRNPVIVLSCL